MFLTFWVRDDFNSSIIAFNMNRIQSDHLPAIAPILESLIERVEKLAQPKIRLVNASPLPIAALNALVDAHYKSYQNVQIIRVSFTLCSQDFNFGEIQRFELFILHTNRKS